MLLEYTVIIIVTIGVVLGIIFGKYRLVNRYPVESISSTKLSENTEEINEFIITQTKERINQELQNMAADELKANVVVAISVVFAILVISEFLRIYTSIDSEMLWLPTALVSITTITLFISFVSGIKVLKPRADRFNLWLPRQTNESYAANEMKTQKEIQNEFKKELIDNFESIDSARITDGHYLTWGYALLIGGSLISFITLMLTHIFWIHG